MTVKGVHHLVVVIRVPSGERVQQVLEILDANKIKAQQITAVPFTDGDCSQVMFWFSCSRDVQDAVCKMLAEHGIGEYGSGTDVNVLPLALAKDVRKTEERQADEEAAAADATTRRNKKMSEFQATIKARIAVENMLEIVHEGASFSFDFFMLVVVASVLAAIGLITNSAVVIVAAMLVSPMMGPILGFTFGSVVRDRNLILTGIRSETYGLLVCLFVGFVGGLCAAPASMRQVPWPTSEMASRGDPQSLYVGAAIAIPSGVGVALSIMGQNTNSLVGVAISASLLPPIVNCGILLAEASLAAYYYHPTCLSDGHTGATWHTCCAGRFATPLCPNIADREFCCTNTFYSPKSIAAMGGISLALTMVNIACIWVFGALTFLLKEVAPLPNKSELWTTLVPNARKFNLAVMRGEIKEDALKEELLKERQEQHGRVGAGGKMLKRDVPIMKGALQAREIGATGMSFVMQGGHVKRGKTVDLLRAFRGRESSVDEEQGIGEKET